MKKKINAVVKNAQMLRILVQRIGFFHLRLNMECGLVRSWTVPIKQIQPQPNLPTIGEIKIKTPQIITTKVITPQ
jgi:hypothetical protein